MSDVVPDAVSGASARPGSDDVDLTVRVGRLELENLQLRIEVLSVHLLLLAMERGAPLAAGDPDAVVIQAQINALRDRIENS